MDSDIYKFVSFNCKSVKRSINGIRELCKNSHIVALQETWLLPSDLSYLNSIHDEFGCTGTSAVDTATGMIRGRPYGGVAILWRQRSFPNVTVIQCNNPRVCAIKIVLRERAILVICVYMPTDQTANLVEFTDTLGTVSAIIDNNNIDCVYVLGDFNAHPTELWFKELSLFCEEQEWTCIDIEFLKDVPNCFTFVSEAHGSQRWLDHCIVSKAAVPSVHKVYINYDILWSDHFPLLIECKLEVISPTKHVSVSTSIDNVIWGERSVGQIEMYNKECNSKLKHVNFPNELQKCADYTCNEMEHRHIIFNLYKNIVNILRESAVVCKEQNYNGIVRKKKKPVMGWNLHVGEAHRMAREKFYVWCWYGKPNSGISYDEMCKARKIFKSRLKWCQNHQEQIRMDKLATHHSKHDFRSFWKATNKLNTRQAIPVCVDGVSCPREIANLFGEHFAVKSPLGPSQSMLDVQPGRKVGISCTATEVSLIIKSMTKGKSPGHDSLSIEHLQHAGPHLPRLLAMLFNLCLSHSYLPEEMIKTVVIPIVKNKTADLSDKSNYRPISLATVVSKVFDRLLNSQLECYIQPHTNQFGFRAGLSTESAVLCVKNTVRYYTSRETPVHACFLDLSKAFDLVSYDILWKKLEDMKLPPVLINICKYWYGNQINRVRWSGAMSQPYRLECGVRQGGLSSPILFNLYINDLIVALSGTRIGCHIDGVSVNNISYADDMVLLSASICGIKKLVTICEAYAERHGLKYNASKSELMVFEARGKNTVNFPEVKLNGKVLCRVHKFKYLGHLITSDLRDDDDIERERRALAIRANMIARRFARCSKDVKTTLFKSYCTSFYSSSLWADYTQKAYSTLRVQYNNAFRVLMGLPRYCSASGMFAEYRLDCFYATMRKRCASLVRRVGGSANSILSMIASRLDCTYINHCCAISNGMAQQ